MVRYNINDSDTEHTYGPNVGQMSPQMLRTQLFKLDETHTFCATLLNQASLGYTRFFSNTASDTPNPYYTIAGFFTDLGSLPGAQSFNQNNAYSTYEFFDNVTKVLHTSNLKFGTQIRVNRQVQRCSPSRRTTSPASAIWRTTIRSFCRRSAMPARSACITPSTTSTSRTTGTSRASSC